MGIDDNHQKKTGKIGGIEKVFTEKPKLTIDAEEFQSEKYPAQ